MKQIFFFIAQGVFLSLVICSVNGDSENSGTESWNELVFTQLWGYASCLQFKDESHGKLKCRYEGKPSIWSIHGIWPTKVGTSGPNFCTKVKFDEDMISSIEDQLNEYWYEINEDKDGTNFWTHEWIKHGSCAKELTQMDSELKYFQTGLQLRNQYDLYSILKDGGVIPQASSDGYKLQNIVAAVEKTLKVTPFVQCYESKEEGSRVFHLLAIEICFNRSLQPISCSSREQVTQINGDDAYGYGATVRCPTDAPILYSDNFPEVKKQEL